MSAQTSGNSCLTGIYFGGSKTEKTGFLRICFSLCFLEDFFTGTWFWRRSLGIPIFGYCLRMFLQEFLPVLYLHRIPLDSCSHQKLSGLDQRLNKVEVGPGKKNPPGTGIRE